MRYLVLLACACGNTGARSLDAPGDVGAIDAPFPCRVTATAGPQFGASVAISDPANQSFSPVIAARAGLAVVAWHEFPAGTSASRVVVAPIVDGCVGALTPVPESLAGGKRVTIAATASGFTLAYDAMDTTGTVVRAIDLDSSGTAIGMPVTISAAGASGAFAHVAAHGDDVAFAWTDGNAHYFARRGPVETVAATPVGTTLLATGLLDYPRLAVASTGELLLAYRDGGADSADWDVLVVARPVGGGFSQPANVSKSPGLLSDDITLAIEADDTLDLAWVDQDGTNVEAFEVDHATRSPAGALSSPARFGSQNMQAWAPSVVPGLAAVWTTGTAAAGPLWLALDATPQAILPGTQGNMTALAADADGSQHLAYVTTDAIKQIGYALRR